MDDPIELFPGRDAQADLSPRCSPAELARHVRIALADLRDSVCGDELPEMALKLAQHRLATASFR